MSAESGSVHGTFVTRLYQFVPIFDACMVAPGGIGIRIPGWATDADQAISIIRELHRRWRAARAEQA